MIRTDPAWITALRIAIAAAMIAFVAWVVIWF